MQSRQRPRVIRNRGQRDLLAARVPDRTILRMVGLNAKRLLSRWKDGLEVPAPYHRLRLEEELGIPQVFWLAPATDDDQRDAMPAPPLAQVESTIGEKPGLYAHVPVSYLWTYAWALDIARYGYHNAVRLDLNQPIAARERPSNAQVWVNLSVLERWLLSKKLATGSKDDGKRSRYQPTIDRIGRREYLPNELEEIGTTVEAFENLQPTAALLSWLGIESRVPVAA